MLPLYNTSQVTFVGDCCFIKLHIWKIVMGTYCLKILFAMLVCFLHTQASILGFNSSSHVKCIERERQALLNFKQGLRDDSCMLSTWSNGDNNRDCCKWKERRRLQQWNRSYTLQALFLNNNSLSGEISSFIQNSSWCNRLVFQTQDLSDNRITGMLPILSNFTSLRRLDISNNQLTGEIPKSIGLLHELEYLSLEENYLEGDITESHLTNLSKLKVLGITWQLIVSKVWCYMGSIFPITYFGTSFLQVGS